MRRLTLPRLALLFALFASPLSAVERKPFIRTDVNQNGRLDFADPFRALAYLMSGGPAPGCIDAMDSNDDGRADFTDVVLSLLFLFARGAAPSAPFPSCGEDPTADALGCESSLYCDPPVPNIREAIGHCGGVPATGYPNSLVRGDELHKVTLRAARAVCNDGSPAVMYVRSAPADSRHADRWIFYLQGGGGCGSFEECLERWCSVGTIYDESKMSSLHTPESIGGTGIFRRDAINAFGDFNQVFLYYCSSDSWAGRADDSVLTDPNDPVREFSVHFRGHTILAEALRVLLPGGLESDDREVVMPPLETAVVALLTGFSAGSGGVLYNGDWFASMLEPNGTAVRLVRSSSINPPGAAHPDPAVAAALEEGLEESYRSVWQNVFGSAMRNAFVDESALAALAATGEEWRVLDKPHVLLNHITTPYFQYTDLMDRGTRLRYEEEYGISAQEFADMMRTTLLRLPDVPGAAIESASITRTPGALGTLCGDHVGLMNNSIFYRRTVEDENGTPRSYHDALVAWLAGTDVSLVDDPRHRTTVCGAEQDENE